MVNFIEILTESTEKFIYRTGKMQVSYIFL